VKQRALANAPNEARTWRIAALALCAACSGADRAPAGPLPQINATGGPETVLLRFPVDGGVPRSYRWPRLDSIIWSGRDRLPAIDRVLAFDQGGGLVAIVSSTGRAGRVDLRTGLLQLPSRVMSSTASADGWSLYGVDEEGRLLRNTPTADWRGPIARADSIVALAGGAVALVSHEGEGTQLIRIRPPAASPRDTLEIARLTSLVRNANGDRLYGITERGVVSIDTRTWTTTASPSSRRVPNAVAPSPSGDRVFVLEDNGRLVRVWLRYAERYATPIRLPEPANALRMDPLGRFFLARVELQDSAYVVSVPLGRVIQTVATEWREDLPAFAPDGLVLTLRRTEVAALDPETGIRRLRVRNGSRDYWTFVRWDGFRPRDSALDEPATFAMDTPADSAAAADYLDSLLAANAARAAQEIDSIGRATASRRSAGDALPDSAAGFTLSFASLLSETSARNEAERIRVDGRRPRIVATSRDGVTIYRIIAGPYPTREEAEAAGRRTGVPFWVFAGLP
jgi:hypothetical protein